MKGPLDRTKVVLRHLPPTISQSALMEQVDCRFAGCYDWVSFRPGKSSHKHQLFSRAYINFKRPEDVIEFAAFFDGHVFVNEKGTQCKAVVEYAPSQRIPKVSKKDGREGTVLKDPEYLEFLEFLAKPVENLPSAEIQLERKEAERAGASKDAPIVTPLMDFVRQKRATKSGPRKSLSNGKATRRSRGISSGTPSSAPSKRGSEKRKTSTTMYVLRDSAKRTSSKDKPAYILVSKRDDEQILDKLGTSVVSSASGPTEEGSVLPGGLGTNEAGKKKILLLKGKEKEISHGTLSFPENLATPTTIKQNHRRDPGVRIRNILLTKETRQGQSSSVGQPEQQIQASTQEKDKRPPRLNVQLFTKDMNGALDDNVAGNDLVGNSNEKPERRTRNKDRPDRGVWTPLRRSDGPHASDESLTTSTSQASQSMLDSAEGTHGEMKNEIVNARNAENKSTGGGNGTYSSFDNGSHKRGGRRGPPKDADGLHITSEGKPLKRGSSGYGIHEKQVWVQKSSSGS